MIRPLAALAAAALALAALTACTPNDVNPALSWLDGQDGVAQATVVVDRSSLYGTSGVLRGELEPGLDGARLDLLVDRVAGYARDHENIELRLGIAGVDFVVDADADAARASWEHLVDLDGLVAALATGDAVRVHVLRPDAPTTLDALDDLHADVELEAFRDAEAEELDRSDDDYGPPQWSTGDLQFLRAASCAPDAEQWERFRGIATEDAVDEGILDACGDYALTYRDETDLAAVATQWAQAQAEARSPIPTLTVAEDGAAFHSIAVTPGDAALFPVVAPFEQDGAPLVRYPLGADGTLELSAWDETPATQLLDLLRGSGIADRLTSISLEGYIEGAVGGESITAVGTLADLGTLVEEASALVVLDPSFYQVAIAPDSVRIDLYSPPGTDPDMASAAAALRTSPIWQTRDTYVAYLNGYVLISDGVATIGADYTDREPFDAFIAAWNGAA